MNAIDFLLQEHQHLRQSLQHISNDSKEKSKQEKFEKLCQELIRHEDMEHEVWYPNFQKKIPTKVKHLLTEERHAEKAIKQFDEIKSQEAWEEKFSKFRKAVEQHAREEEKELFPEVKKLLSADDLEQIGLLMSQYKKSHPLH